MTPPFGDLTARRKFSDMSLKLRILISAALIVVCGAVDVLFYRSGYLSGFIGDAICLIFVALILFRPQWIDRWNKRTLREIERGDPDLRKWM